MANWHELIIKGGDKEILAYLKGFFAGRGITEGFYFGEDEAFHLRHVREFIKYHGDVAHLICDTGLRSTVATAIRKASKEFDFEIKESRKITAVSFEFDFKTELQEVGDRNGSAPSVEFKPNNAFSRLNLDMRMRGYLVRGCCDHGRARGE